MPLVVEYLLFDELSVDPTASGVPEGGFWYNTQEDRLKQKVGTVSGTEIRTYTIEEDITENPTVVANTSHRTTVSGNPHFVDKVDVGLGNVVNGEQLLRTGGDFNFSEKTTPEGADYILIEDSSDGGAKKLVRLSNLPTISGTGEDFDNIVWDNDGRVVYDNSDIAVRRA